MATRREVAENSLGGGGCRRGAPGGGPAAAPTVIFGLGQSELNDRGPASITTDARAAVVAKGACCNQQYTLLRLARCAPPTPRTHISLYPSPNPSGAVMCASHVLLSTCATSNYLLGSRTARSRSPLAGFATRARGSAPHCGSHGGRRGWETREKACSPGGGMAHMSISRIHCNGGGQSRASKRSRSVGRRMMAGEESMSL